HDDVRMLDDQPLEDRLPLLVLDVERQALLRPVGPDEVRREAHDTLVVRAREIAHAGPLDLDDARTEVGKLPRAERRGDRMLERDDGDAIERSHRLDPSVGPAVTATGQNDRGKPSTCSATYAKIRFVDIGAT